jgi:hypothetical protein
VVGLSVQPERPSAAGVCDARFVRVREAFEDNFVRHG